MRAEGQRRAPAVPDGGLVRLTVRIAGVGPWGVQHLAETYAGDLLRSGRVVGARIDDGPGQVR